MVSVKIVGLIVGSVALATLLVNRTFAEDPSHTMTASAASAPPVKIRVVRVSGEDFKFDAPDVIPAGLSDFRFLNKGPALHHMSILKLEDGKTIDDLRAALANPGPPPAWVKEVGGPNAAAPGVESNATVMLEPGNYALICFIDIGGPPHFMKGMLKGLRVVAATGPVASKPTPDVTVTLMDYNFKLSAPLRAGMRTFRVQNTGSQHHEVELVQLAPGVSAADFMKWIEKMEGPPPGKALGGVSGIESGMSAYFTADLSPGNYALICFLPDSKDGKPHFAHGMIQQITVN
jgi:uncharacterized cupredoxin-like copper-binding protein